MTSASGWLVGQKQALLNVANARIQLRLSNPDETQMEPVWSTAGRPATTWTGPASV